MASSEWIKDTTAHLHVHDVTSQTKNKYVTGLTIPEYLQIFKINMSNGEYTSLPCIK